MTAGQSAPYAASVTWERDAPYASSSSSAHTPLPLGKGTQEHPNPSWRQLPEYAEESYSQETSCGVLAVLFTMDARRSSGEHLGKGGSVPCRYSWIITGGWKG
jgi:hypothetical protein